MASMHIYITCASAFASIFFRECNSVLFLKVKFRGAVHSHFAIGFAVSAFNSVMHTMIFIISKCLDYDSGQLPFVIFRELMCCLSRKLELPSDSEIDD